MKIRITKGDGWYNGKIGEIFEIDEVVDDLREGVIYYVDAPYTIGGRRFVSAANAEVIDEETPQADPVNSPQHYTNGRFETIEIIEEITKGYDNGYVAYLVGNTLKYLARAPYKHDEPTEDLRKAERYIAFAIEHLTKEGE